MQRLGRGVALAAMAPWRALAGDPAPSPAAAAAGQPGAAAANAPWFTIKSLRDHDVLAIG